MSQTSMLKRMDCAVRTLCACAHELYVFSVFVSVLVCVCLLLQQQDTINEDIVEIDDKMDTLKTHLKSKFGSQVQF